jgi:hypothetical protein
MPRPLYVDKVALGQVLLRVPRSYTASITTPKFHIHSYINLPLKPQSLGTDGVVKLRTFNNVYIFDTATLCSIKKSTLVRK